MRPLPEIDPRQSALGQFVAGGGLFSASGFALGFGTACGGQPGGNLPSAAALQLSATATTAFAGEAAPTGFLGGVFVASLVSLAVFAAEVVFFSVFLTSLVFTENQLDVALTSFGFLSLDPLIRELS